MLAAISCMSLAAQKNDGNILRSSDDKEIETFLKSAHPDDPRRGILKTKLIALRNTALMKSVKPPVNPPKPAVKQTPNYAGAQKNQEEEEFRQLAAQNSGEHKQKTVKLLNQLFDNDENNKEAILLIQNNSNCNMIIRVLGKESYNLPIAAHGENSVVLKKGNYQLSGTACNAKYSSVKSIAKNMIVTLNNPGANPPAGKYVQVGQK